MKTKKLLSKRIKNQKNSKKSRGAEPVHCIPQYSFSEKIMPPNTFIRRGGSSGLRRFVY
jgi:hypothetical protein